MLPNLTFLGDGRAGIKDGKYDLRGTWGAEKARERHADCQNIHPRGKLDPRHRGISVEMVLRHNSENGKAVISGNFGPVRPPYKFKNGKPGK